MAEPSKRVSAEALLAHAGWLRQLAASLVADPGAADDVVQETWLAALLHPPAQDRPLEPWLARVARNFAFQRKRGELRRAVHELAAEPVREPLTPAQTVERLALQRAVVEAVLAIDEPFRTTIVQRYFEGHSSAAIARMYGLPPGTVRWRLKRGLAELRVRLDTRFGSREGWCALLAPLAGSGSVPRPHAGTTTTTGTIPRAFTALATLGTTHGAVLGAALIVAAGLTWWSLGWRSVSTSAAPTVAESDVVATVPARATASSAALASVPSDTRQGLAPGSGSERAPPAPAPSTAARTAAVDVRFFDSDGAPLGGVGFEAHIESGSSLEPPPPALSRPDGRALLELRFPERGMCSELWFSAEKVAFVASRTGCTTIELHAVARVGETTHLGDVVLGPGVRLSGRVLDELGRGIAGAAIGTTGAELPPAEDGRLRRHGSKSFSLPRATSAQDGTFVLDGVGAGTWRVWAQAPGTRYAWSEPIAVTAERELVGPDLVLAALEPGDRIEGRIVGPEGEPVHASLLCDSSTGRFGGVSVTTPVDEQGRFSFLVEHDGDLWDLIAVDTSGRLAAARVEGVRPGTLDLVLRMPAMRFVEVSVRAADDRAVEDAAIVVGVGSFWSPAGVESLAPGRYRVPVPEDSFELEVSARGHRTAHCGPFAPAAAPLEVRLQAAPVVRGRVVAAGRAVAGAHVELRTHDPEALCTVNGFRCLMGATEIAGTTDDGGRFELACDLDRAFWIRATAEGRAPCELGPLALGTLDPAPEFELVLTEGGVLEGRVLPPEGGAAEGAIVAINHGDGEPRSIRAGPGGFFRFEGLAPGPWQVLARETDLDPGSTRLTSLASAGPIEWSCELVAGRTTHYDLDLRGK